MRVIDFNKLNPFLRHSREGVLLSGIILLTRLRALGAAVIPDNRRNTDLIRGEEMYRLPSPARGAKAGFRKACFAPLKPVWFASHTVGRGARVGDEGAGETA
jgi:hypothetical protein